MSHSDPQDENPPVLRSMTKGLQFAERLTFGIVGILLTVVALTLAFRSLGIVFALITGPSSSAIPLTAQFLDLVLLILMLAEIIYTVTLSLSGAKLSAQPFLIVGLIAVIRRILVLTVEEVQTGAPVGSGVTESTLDLAVLTLVAVAFVGAIFLLRYSRPQSDST